MCKVRMDDSLGTRAKLARMEGGEGVPWHQYQSVSSHPRGQVVLCCLLCQ